MNKMLIGLALVSSIAAQAQTSSTSATTAAPTTQTSTMTTTEAKPAAASPYGAIVYVESATGIQSVKDNGNSTPISTVYTLGLNYKTGKMKYEVAQLAYSRTNQNRLEGSEAIIFTKDTSTENTVDSRGNFVMAQPYLRGTYSSEQRLLNSEPVAFSLRYYFPTSAFDHDSRNKSNGFFRADINPSWILSPKWTFDFMFSPRMNLYLEGATRGTDPRYRLVSGPVMTYNVSDAFNAYYLPYVDVRSYDVGRGTLSADAGNAMNHEVGLNIVIGKVTINPMIDCSNSMNDGTAGIFTTDSRFFAADTSNYNLNI